MAGNGGYYNLSKLKTNAQGEKPTPGQQTEPDGQGNTITLEQFNDTSYGFLRVTVDATSIEVEALGVSGTSTTTSPTSPVPAPMLVDHFVVNLGPHTVTTEAQGETHASSKQDKPEPGEKK